MRTFRNLFLAIVAPVILSACGQKGPLYLPESEQDVSQVSSLSMSAASRNNTASANKTIPSK